MIRRNDGMMAPNGVYALALGTSSQLFLLCFAPKQIPMPEGTVSSQKWPYQAWFQLQTHRWYTRVWRALGMATDGKNLFHSLVLTNPIPFHLPTPAVLHVNNSYHVLNTY